MKKINQLDLFSGIGGFHLGFEKAGYKVKSYFSEVDKHAIAVYKHKFKDSEYVGSVEHIKGNELPRIDLITFGSPCQDFSLAGKRKGQESTSMRDKNSLARTLNARAAFGQGSDDTFIKVKSATKAGYEVAEEGDSINLSNPNSETRRGRVGKGKAQTLETSCNQAAVQDYRIRRLTPIECERLQGFPDNHTQYGNYDGEVKLMSNTQRYKQCGNAVTTDVVQAIAEKIKPLFK